MAKKAKKSEKTVFDIRISHSFDAGACIRALGVEERGRLVEKCAEEILRLSGDYVPFKDGHLLKNGVVENGRDVVWDEPYAHYLWEGIVYEDPDLHCAGFQTDNGWRSKKKVKKIPTERSLKYGGGNLRGSHWVDSMLNDGGLEKITGMLEKEMRK